MTRKLRRVIPLLLILTLVLSLTAFAGDKRAPTYLKKAPTVSAVGIASKPLSTLDLIGGSAVNKTGDPVPGLFVWADPNEVMVPGIHEVPVVFKPTDSKTYSSFRFTVKVHSYKLNLTVKKLPTVEEESLGVNQPVSELTLYDGIAVDHFVKSHPPIDGHFEFLNPDQKFDKAGTYEVPVVFKPANSDLYNDAVVTYARNPDRTFKDAFVTVTVK